MIVRVLGYVGDNLDVLLVFVWYSCRLTVGCGLIGFFVRDNGPLNNLVVILLIGRLVYLVGLLLLWEHRDLGVPFWGSGDTDVY